ncbi:MAG: PilZ domain-containing protein [Desulfobulbaceae bacterium]|nr:PilZ domain-containing protein [Desulfobulbaceae bacterium]
MPEQYDDRRRDPRVVFRTTAKVIFSDGRAFADCETSDISISGVFVNGVTGVGVGCGEKCRIELRLVGKTSNLLLKISGEIVRFQEDGVALEFSEVGEDSFYHLRNIVYFSYKHADVGQGDLISELDDTGDENLYLNLDAGNKSASLPDHYLAGVDIEEDDFDDDLADNIPGYIRQRQDDDDDDY